MTSITTFVASNGICLVLFLESLWIGLVQTIRRQAIHPPVAPPSDAEHPPATVPPVNDAYQAISLAVHPHLHHHPTASRPATTASCKPRLTTSCSSTTTVTGRCISRTLYHATIPYLSTHLLTLQSLLGTATTLATLLASPSSAKDCTRLAQYTLIAWHLGLTLVFLAAAVQTHIANQRCVKIFFIFLLGTAVNSALLGVVLGRQAYGGLVGQRVCLVDMVQPPGWLGNLPTYLGVSHFLTGFLTAVSYINAASRLCPRARFLSFKELSFALMVYRGLGLLFLAFLLFALLGALTILLGALHVFHYAPWWVVQWAVVSRVFAAGMRHRAEGDGVAQGHPFWASEEYLRWHPVVQAEDGNTWKPRVSSAVVRYAGSLMHIVCTTTAHSALAVGSDGHDKSKSDNNATNVNTLRRVSRHDTVVEDTFHCPSCTCAIF